MKLSILTVVFILFTVSLKSETYNQFNFGFGSFIFNKEPIQIMTGMSEDKFKDYNFFESFHMGLEHKISKHSLYFVLDLMTGLSEFKGKYQQNFIDQSAFDSEFSKFSFGKAHLFSDPATVFQSPIEFDYNNSFRITELRLGIKKYLNIGKGVDAFVGGGLTNANISIINTIEFVQADQAGNQIHKINKQSTQIAVYYEVGLAIKLAKNIFISAAHSQSAGGDFKVANQNLEVSGSRQVVKLGFIF